MRRLSPNLRRELASVALIMVIVAAANGVAFALLAYVRTTGALDAPGF